MELIDSHCHIHFDTYPLDVDAVLLNAASAGVKRLICVGTTVDDSAQAIDFASRYENVWAAAGVHPHDAEDFVNKPELQQKFTELLDPSTLCAVGEVGLDYYKKYSSQEHQKEAVKIQIEISKDLGLPYIFHVRQAFDDFWPIFDSFSDLRGVVHSFSDDPYRLDEIVERGLMVGLNGIMTFTKDEKQLEAAKKVPLENLILETDAPFLTPEPYRGKTCEPKHVVDVAKFLADLRKEPIEELAAATTANAEKLFGLRK